MKNVQEIYFRALIPFYKTEVFTSHGRAGKEKTVPLVLSRGQGRVPRRISHAVNNIIYL